MSNTAQVLLKLLEKVPNTDHLQRLLEPENLLYLLQQYGYQKEDLQKRLKSGTLPGELLLELLEQEPDSEYLLVMLSNTMDTKVEKRVVIDDMINQMKKDETSTSVPPVSAAATDTTPKTAKVPPAQMSMPSSAAMSDEGKNLFDNNYMVGALVVVTLTSIIPALMRSGFFPDLVPDPEPMTVIALIGGAVAGAIFSYGSANTLWKGVLLGIVLNLGVLWATIGYTQERTSLFKIEIAIPLFLGSLPAVGLYYLLNRKK